MRYFKLVLFLIAVACGCSEKNFSTNAANTAISGKNTIQIKVNEEKSIQLRANASISPQMGFTVADTSIAKVSRKEIISTFDTTGLRPGDPVLAVWVVKGLKPGITRLKFSERRREKIDDATVQLKNLKIVVTE